MSGSNTSDQNTPPPTHEDFRWIHGPGKTERFAGFIELTRDMSAGIHTCMRILYASHLVREENRDAEPGQAAAPSIGATDAADLFRLSMSAAALLRHIADEHIDRLNKFWDE